MYIIYIYSHCSVAETTTTETIILQLKKKKNKNKQTLKICSVNGPGVTYRLLLRVYKDARLLKEPTPLALPAIHPPLRLSVSRRLELGWGWTTSPHRHQELSTSGFIRSATCLLVGDRGRKWQPTPVFLPGESQ